MDAPTPVLEVHGEIVIDRKAGMVRGRVRISNNDRSFPFEIPIQLLPGLIDELEDVMELHPELFTARVINRLK